MKIYFFSRDPVTGLYEAGCKANGKRFVSVVWRQGMDLYVKTGAAITKDLQRYNLTATQVKAFSDFVDSGAYSFEDMAGIE